ncbi:efflux RND transporter periplasmic adaptor subunit [Butyrivibrio sp. INlla16]|uniref:efflux RND transporter periplasmic adaptor subunit n=1 Tax=Butyrivibrio sp. INlla16 TaxID=1520807 RepID=UPI000889F482|nr:efflux RND transporter periplasmic adaptor subunit [Butyrivibrio sp. INlla16]SDB03544.1 RND family efflux transporter, MFP subunit [Butyrivibrio sp. INlla16]
MNLVLGKKKNSKDTLEVNGEAKVDAAQEAQAEVSQETKTYAVKEDAPSYTPGKKKGFVKFIVLGLIVLIVGWVVFNNIKAKNAPTPVTTATVGKGDIEVIVSISGNVASDETKSYYAKLQAPIGTLSLSEGDRVNKGDVIYTYDEAELEKTKKQAELNLQQANGSYSGSIEKNNKATDVLEGRSIHDINNRLDEITSEIDAINDKITEKTSRMNQTLTDLQKVSQDVDQNRVSDSYDAALKNEGPNERRTEDGESQMALEIQDAISDVQYALSNDPEIQEWNRQITALNEEKQDLSEQSSAEMSALTSGEKSSLAAQRELAELESTNTITDIEEAEGGIKADFSGVVTEIGANEGSTVAPGTKIMTIESTDDVRVDIQISKSDLSKIKKGQKVDVTINGNDYEGEVTQVSGTAKNNASGVPVVDGKIKLKNPDDSIILGVEATNKIHTEKAEGVLVLPYEYIGTDSEGDFVFVIDNGILKRQPVTLGLTTSTDAEIKEGVSEGDTIVTTDPTTLVEGTKVIEMSE